MFSLYGLLIGNDDLRCRWFTMYAEAIKTRVLCLSVIWLDAQFYNFIRSPDIQIFNWKILQGGIVIDVLILTEEYRLVILFMLETLGGNKMTNNILVENKTRNV